MWFQASAAVYTRSSLFWHVTLHRLVVTYFCFGTTCRSNPLPFFTFYFPFIFIFLFSFSFMFPLPVMGSDHFTSEHPLGQGWRMCGMRKDFLVMLHSLLSLPPPPLAWPAFLCCDEYVDIHISDCIEIVFELLLLPNNIEWNIFTQIASSAKCWLDVFYWGAGGGDWAHTWLWTKCFTVFFLSSKY